MLFCVDSHLFLVMVVWRFDGVHWRNILRDGCRRSRLPPKFLQDVHTMTRRALHGTNFILRSLGSSVEFGVECNLAIVPSADLNEVEVLFKKWLHHLRDMDHAAAVRFGLPVPELDFDVYIVPQCGYEDQESIAHIHIACPYLMYYVRHSDIDVSNRPGPDLEPAEVEEQELSRRVWRASCGQG